MTVSAFLICLVAALILGALTALVFSFRSEHSSNLPFALVLVPPIVTLVIMMVNGNIGAGLGVAGAFSLIRFRSAPGTARELSGLFTGTAIGLACGMGYVGIAALFFLIVAITVIALTLLRFGEKSRSFRQLKITIPENLDYDGLFDDLLNAYFASCELIRVRTVEMGTAYQLIYRGVLRDVKEAKQFLDAVRERNGNLPVALGRVADVRGEM
jgi:hypothetical protein